MKLYNRRERPDSSTPVFEPATPADIAEAMKDDMKLIAEIHPKCIDCIHVEEDGYCGNEKSERYHTYIDDMESDYCPKHYLIEVQL